LKVVSVNTSRRKGVAKQEVPEIILVEGQGVRGDAHAGPGDRQVSLLARESYDRFYEKSQHKICLKNGAFGENMVTEGIVLHKLGLGTRLRIGDALVEVSKIGKECHAPCAIAKAAGECIMPKEGIFVRVVTGGAVGKGASISLA